MNSFPAIHKLLNRSASPQHSAHAVLKSPMAPSTWDLVQFLSMKFKAIYHLAPNLPSQDVSPMHSSNHPNQSLTCPSPLLYINGTLSKTVARSILAFFREVILKEAALPWGICSAPMGHVGWWRSGNPLEMCFHSHSPALPENASRAQWHKSSLVPPPSPQWSSLIAEERPNSPSPRIWPWCNVTKCQGIWVPENKKKIDRDQKPLLLKMRSVDQQPWHCPWAY